VSPANGTILIIAIRVRSKDGCTVIVIVGEAAMNRVGLMVGHLVYAGGDY